MNYRPGKRCKLFFEVLVKNGNNSNLMKTKSQNICTKISLICGKINFLQFKMLFSFKNCSFSSLYIFQI